MSISDWKAREKEQRSNDILEAARKLFYADGYDDVSMADIAAEVGIKKPTLYLYFKNKEALFFALVARANTIRNDLVRAEVSKGTTGPEKLAGNTRALTEFFSKYPEYSWADNFFHSGRFDLENTGDEDVRKILDLQSELFEIISDCLRTGMSDGAYLPDVDPLSMAVVLTVVAENLTSLRPDYKYVLERGGVDQGKFMLDVSRLMKRAMSGDGKAKK